MALVDAFPTILIPPGAAYSAQLPRTYRFRIAQLFHELAADAGAIAAADAVTASHGIPAAQVRRCAEEFRREPLWRL